MENLDKISEKLDQLIANHADWELKVYSEISAIRQLNLDHYIEEARDKERQRLWDKGNADRDVVHNTYIASIKAIEDQLKDSYDNTALLKERTRFAQERGISLDQADREIEKYVMNPNIAIEDILDKSNPHYHVFADALARTGRAPKTADFATIEKKTDLKTRLGNLRDRVEAVRRASLGRYDYDSSNALLRLSRMK